MSWKFAKLFEISLEHAYYRATSKPAFSITPTSETRQLLLANKIVFRQTPAGCVGLYEIDPFDENGVLPIAVINKELELEFAIGSTSNDFHSVTDFPADTSPFVALLSSNGTQDGQRIRLHANTELDQGDLQLLKGESFELVIESQHVEVQVELRGNDNRIYSSDTLKTKNGKAFWEVNLSHTPSGEYTLLVNGLATQAIYYSAELFRTAAIGIVTLQAHNSLSPDTGFLDGNGTPVFRNYFASFPSKVATWRYIVIPKTNTTLDENSLNVTDTILVNGSPRYEFQATGPKQLLANGDSAVIFASTTEIPFSQTPTIGLQLAKTGPNATTSSIYENLPNPSPTQLSQATTASDPVSDVFIYV